MNHLTDEQLTLYVTETGIEYRVTAHEGQFDVYIASDSPDNFEVSIEEWGDCIHDSVPFPSLLEALRAADEMIEEVLDVDNTADVDARITAQEARLDESLDHKEDQRTIDRARDLLDSISEPLYLLSGFEREFLAVLADSPLDAAFARHLKPDSAAAFERFKQMGFVEIAVIDDRWHITNGGRRALALPSVPHID